MDKGIKIFVIGPRGFPNVQGGIERFSESLYPRLAALGCDVTTFAIKRYCTHSEWKGVKFAYVPTPSSKTLEKFIYNFYTAVYCIFKRPDIIHVHSIASGFFIFLMKLSGLKIIARYNSRDYLHGKWSRLGKFILKASEKQFMFANYIIANNKSYISHWQEKGRTKNLEYIPNGVTYYPETENHEGYEIFQKRGIQKNNYILAVSRITAEKNIETLIRAFLKLEDKNLLLVIAGEAAHNDSYAQTLMDSVAGNTNIVLAGKQERDQLNWLYANARLFVHPSFFEGMPNVLLEALSFNCDVLLSNIPSHTEFEFDSASYFEASDINDLHGKLKNKLMKRKLPDYTFILNKHNWDTIANQVLAICKNVIKK